MLEKEAAERKEAESSVNELKRQFSAVKEKTAMMPVMLRSVNTFGNIEERNGKKKRKKLEGSEEDRLCTYHQCCRMPLAMLIQHFCGDVPHRLDGFGGGGVT